VELMRYFKLLRSLRDKREEACVKKGLACQGLRAQAVLLFAVHCYGTGQRMSDIGVKEL